MSFMNKYPIPQSHLVCRQENPNEFDLRVSPAFTFGNEQFPECRAQKFNTWVELEAMLHTLTNPILFFCWCLSSKCTWGTTCLLSPTLRLPSDRRPDLAWTRRQWD